MRTHRPTAARRRGRLVLTALAAVAALAAPQAAFATVSTTPDTTAQVAGTVYDIALLDADHDPSTPARAYVGGSFARAGGKDRANVAAINPDGKVDVSFAPSTNGTVRAVALSQDGGTLFIGGTFTEVNGVPRANLAAVDAVTGQLLDGWRADTAGAYPDVRSLAVAGDRVYVGGRFVRIDGKAVRQLAAVGATTGDVLTGFKPDPDGLVAEVVTAPDGSTVYAGGAFTTLGGQPRPSAGAVDAVTGAATGFAPSGKDAGNAITIDLSPDGSRFSYATENNTLFTYDTASSKLLWSSKTSCDTQAITQTDDEMWIGGHFSQIVNGHIARNYVASVDPLTGSVNAWDPNCSGGKMGVWALRHDGGHLHAGGVFKAFGAVSQRGYARFVELP